MHKPNWRKNCLDDELITLGTIVDGTLWRTLVVSYWLFSIWYQNHGLDKLMYGEPDALELLHLAALNRELELRSKGELYVAVPSIGGVASTDCHEAANAFALTIQLGRWKEAELTFETLGKMGSPVLRAFGRTATSAYIVRLYALCVQKEVPDHIAELPVIPIYAQVLESWESTELEPLKTSLLAACDFLVQQSRASTNSKWYEFDTERAELQPNEILAVLRLRELRGLENPELNHPLMKAPAGKLYPIIHLTRDPVFEASHQALVRNIHALATDKWSNK